MCSCAKKTSPNGRYSRLLDSSQRMYRYTWQFRFVLYNFYSYIYFKILLAKATYAAMAMTYSYLTPDLWKETVYTKAPFQEYSDHLANTHKKYTVGLGDKHYQ